MELEEFIHSEKLETFCQKYHIRHLSFFGSVLRGDFRPESDVDILVEFESDQIPGYDFFLIEAELTQMLGRKVDLQTPNFLSPEIRRQVIAEALSAYEQTRS